MGDFTCPWPEGGHLEYHFPCCIRLMEIVDDYIHNEVPGHLVEWYIGYIFTLTFPGILLGDSRERQKFIKALETRSLQAEKILNELNKLKDPKACARYALRDSRIRDAIIDAYIPQHGHEVRELLERLLAKRIRRLRHKEKIKACLKCPKAKWDYFCRKIREDIKRKLEGKIREMAVDC